jgi:rare lipoprotein A
MLLRAASAAIVFGLGGCMSSQNQPPPGPPAFTVGPAYQSQGEWRYPHNFSNYDETGLSTVIAGDQSPYTADHESYDPDAIDAASPVLQLPCIVTLTNLENGESMDVRVNDRGPDNPGRLIAVTPKVASLLGFPQDGVTEVEVTLKPEQSAALDAQLGQGPKLTAAPVAGITAESLGPPGQNGAQQVQNLTPQDSSLNGPDPGALSGQVTVTGANPGPIWVQIPGFGRPRDADDTLQALGGLPAFVIPVFGGDRTLYAVRLGPYHSVADADAALAAVIQRGIAGPEIMIR